MDSPEYIMLNKLDQLSIILKKQIKWFKDHKTLEAEGKIDSSYIYDLAIEQMADISRGEAVDILELLSDWE